MTGIKPLDGVLVLDFSQFLSGPSASLRLADLGARVIKIERPETGDICRTLYISNVMLDGDSSIFHAINRNKKSYAVDLKEEEGRGELVALIRKADVMIHNFRPGVMDRLGLDYERVRRWNAGVVYAEISGYGAAGPWRDAPGQDLLVQARSGLVWLGASEGDAPRPFGLAVADMIAGAHLAQGILACLARRAITGEGALLHTSLLESVVDFQSDALTAYLNRGATANGGAAGCCAAGEKPGGIYRCADGWLAIAASSWTELAAATGCASLLAAAASCPPEEAKRLISERLRGRSMSHWLAVLESAETAAAPVLTWEALMETEGFGALAMLQEVRRDSGYALRTTRCPIRIDGQRFTAERGAPRVGEHTAEIRGSGAGLDLQMEEECAHDTN